MNTYGVDTMFGSHNSLSTFLNKRFPGKVLIRCKCHGIQFTSSKSSEALPEMLEKMAYAIYSHFSTSLKAELFNCDKTVILSLWATC